MKNLVRALTLAALIVSVAAPAASQGPRQFDPPQPPPIPANAELNVYDPARPFDGGVRAGLTPVLTEAIQGYATTAMREPDAQLLMLTPAGDFTVISLADLLAGLVRFPDNHRRYVAVRDNPGEVVAPEFVAADFTMANSVVGWGTGLDVPAYTGTEQQVFVAIALPSSISPPAFLNMQTVNDGDNSASLLVPQAATVDLDGITCNVYTTSWGALAASLINVYFDPAAAEPTL